MLRDENEYRLIASFSDIGHLAALAHQRHLGTKKRGYNAERIRTCLTFEPAF